MVQRASNEVYSTIQVLLNVLNGSRVAGIIANSYTLMTAAMSLDELINSLLQDSGYPHRVTRQSFENTYVLAYSEPVEVKEIIKNRVFSDQVKMLAIRAKTEISAARYGRYLMIVKNKIGYQVVRSINVLVTDNLSNVDQIFYENF